MATTKKKKTGKKMAKKQVQQSKLKTVTSNVTSVLFKSKKGRMATSVVGILLFAFVGMYLLRLSYAGSPSSPTATKSCGARVENYSYQVPFGQAVWNQPVCGLARHPQSADYANRFIEWGHVNDGGAASDANNGKISTDPGFPRTDQLDPLAGLFTREIYYASKATTQARIQTTVYYSNLDGENLPYGDQRHTLPDTPIPWNPSWKASKGGDNEIMILDDRPGATQGRIYFISGYKTDFQALGQGCLIADRLCTYTVRVGRDLNGNYVDYRTYEGFLDDRGAGISGYATLTTPEEILAGEIRHALGVALPNTAFGPNCTKAQLGTSAEGKTCGTAVAPATKFEWASKTTTPFLAEPFKSILTRDKTIPEGMRFAIDVSDAQIETWINSRADLKSNPRRAETARIFARALKDYGMIVVDTNGGRAGIQTSGGINPDAAAMWKTLQMGPEQKDNLLDGLVTKQNLYVVNPPVATCKDGTKSQYYCQWTSVKYDQTQTTVTPPPTTPDPTPTTPTNPTTPTTPPTTPTTPPTGNNGSVKDTLRPAAPASLNRGLELDLFKFRYNLVLSWPKATDNVGIKDYIVARNGIQLGVTTNTSFVDNTVAAGVPYQYTVVSRDAAGNISANMAKTSATAQCYFIWCVLQ